MSEEHKHDDAAHPPVEPTASHDPSPEAAHEAHDDHAAPAEAETHAESHDAPAAEAHHDEPAHAEPEAIHAEPEHHEEPAHAEAAPEPEPVHVEAAPEPVVAAAAPPPEPEKRPVWSDHGDAPFEDTESTPVYARKGKGSSSGGSGNEFFEILKTVAFALLIALVLRIVLFQPFTIPSASMEPNLYEGDYIVVSKWSYGYSKHSIPWSPPLFKGRILENQPERGDIVVFKLPRDAGQGPNQTDYIKRLIGLPGDRVQMINNVLYLNGTVVPDVVTSRNEVDEVGRTVIRFNETLPGGKTFKAQEWGPGNPLDNTAEFTVPAGYYLMIGDNRDNSLDSREYPENGGVGLVPAENLVGKAEIILFSWHPGASLFNPVSWFSKVRPSRFFTVLN